MDQRYLNLPLNQLRAFATASRHRTFTAAANHMGVTQVAMSRQIMMLEAYLGVKLFMRQARSVEMTEAGRDLARAIVGPLEEIEKATLRVLAAEGQETVTLRAYPSFAQFWLMPRLHHFVSAHSGYRLRLETSLEPLDFLGMHVDVAIQLGHADWREARSRKLFDEVLDVVCAPEAAKRLDASAFTLPPRTRILHESSMWREWAAWSDATGLSIEGCDRMEFDTAQLSYSAAENSMGLAIGQVVLLQDLIEQGRLVRPFNRPVRTGWAYYIVWPTAVSASPQTRNFIDWVLTTTGEEPEFTRKRDEKSAVNVSVRG
ncbi:MAG: LysR family transcriptional regulator [Rhodobacteraceae bacterium PARR1]|nr:MAG: LysR family transcriptional regulator [Rhodobacteraceae bacterium PARR1]